MHGNRRLELRSARLSVGRAVFAVQPNRRTTAPDDEDLGCAGQSSIAVTFDTYGHLFSAPQSDQAAARLLQMRLLGEA